MIIIQLTNASLASDTIQNLQKPVRSTKSKVSMQITRNKRFP